MSGLESSTTSRLCVTRPSTARRESSDSRDFGSHCTGCALAITESSTGSTAQLVTVLRLIDRKDLERTLRRLRPSLRQ